jgi:hypothetical protein
MALAAFTMPNCGGNTDEARAAADAGGGGMTAGVDVSAVLGPCTLTSECVVRPASCCGECGGATRTDVTAINRKYARAYQENLCALFTCPDCHMASDPTLIARCQSGTCRVADLNELSLTTCSADADCRVRVTSCCECGGSVALDDLIAIRRDAEAEYREIACDPATACDECLPPYPQHAAAVCSDGRCVVSGLP